MGEVLCPVLVGRRPEIQALESALAGVLAGRGGCAVITGEAGIGKSRLIRELARMAAGRQVPVVMGRAVPASASAPYRPVTEALLQLLRSRPLPDDLSLAPWLPHLAVLLPEAVADDRATHPGGWVDSQAVRGEAVLRLLRRLAPDGLVVAMEDLHWADPDTISLVEYLADNAADQPVLFACSLRTEPPSPASELARRQRGRAGIVHLPLGRLAEREVAEMITACSPSTDADEHSRVGRASEGVPLFVEELLASSGIPESISETVRERLAEFPDRERAVLEAAAVLGHRFDWEILPAASGQAPGLVSRALARAVDRVLLIADGTGFQFRHALIREAVLVSTLPPRLHQAAANALAAIDAAYPDLAGGWRDVAADLAARSGDRARAGRLLRDSGRYSLEVGALATAAGTLRRAADLLESSPEGAGTELMLIEALALAGRVDEAAAIGTRLIGRLGDDPATRETRTEAHLRLAQAAVSASRWPMARHHIEVAAGLAAAGADPDFSARAAVLSAEVALAGDDLDEARRTAEQVLATDGAGPEVRCHALEIAGRSRRLHDLSAATVAFEAALATAEQAGLPVWRLRALHELGTVDMFERVDVDRLLQARGLGEQMGALSTVAVLDLQLMACFTGRWDLERCDAHGESALELAGRLRLDQVAAKALAMMAGSASMRADVKATEDLAARALAADPADPTLAGFCRASVGMAWFMAGDTAAALRPFAEGTAALSRLPNAEPISIRALWPLIQAAQGDRRAAATLDEVRRLGVDAFHLNRGLIAFTQAVLEGRAGRPGRADAIVAGHATAFANCQAWADLARFIAAPGALADGWGEPVRWLTAARDRFTGLGLGQLAGRCAELLGDACPNPWAGQGVTDREAEVLRLVIAGLANKEIAAALRLSPRTVEKHVENLLRKTGAHSRTELAVTSRHPAT
ncbi:MAG TPA: AAA family ATPase [Streptosporangiaceae bacterium]|nr:AAA family ATPase [Streptosporangiaceae bacterium]